MLMGGLFVALVEGKMQRLGSNFFWEFYFQFPPFRRTMQIIEEQKYRFALYDSQTGGAPLALGLNPVAPKAVVIYKTNARVQEVHAPPKSLATSSSSPKVSFKYLIFLILIL